jgi:hypothetical protein
VQVGSRDAGKGVMVAQQTWQLFQNHARHCDQQTPPSSPLPAAPQCPGANASSC